MQHAPFKKYSCIYVFIFIIHAKINYVQTPSFTKHWKNTASQNIFKAPHKMDKIAGRMVFFEIDSLVDVKRSRGTIWHWQMKHM